MRKKNQQSGFTLLEIIVVLVILGLVISLVPPLLSSALASTKVKAATRELAVNLKQARSTSVEQQIETTLIVDVEKRNFSIGKRQKDISLPNDASLSLITAKSEQLSDNSGQIRFFPDGSSTGGQIKLNYKQKDYFVDVHWLTGKVKILP